MFQFTNRESVESIKALDKELDRLHDLLLASGQHKETATAIFERIKELEKLLMNVTRRYNGMEYDMDEKELKFKKT